MIDDFYPICFLLFCIVRCRKFELLIFIKLCIFILGVIRNTRVLNYTESHSYVLSVVAQDCGLNKSKPLLVTVEVKKACSTGWSGNFFGLSNHGEKILVKIDCFHL